MTDGRDNVTDRVASRFESGDDEKSQNAQKAKNDMKAKNAQNDKSEQRAQSSEPDLANVKEAWSAKSVYLPDELHDDLGKAFKRLDLDLDDDLEEFRKTRHFYPLLIAAGLERLGSMEREEVIERLEGIDPDLERYLTEC